MHPAPAGIRRPVIAVVDLRAVGRFGPTLDGMRARRGMTLMELMVVLLVVGVLAAVAVPVFARVRDNAQRGAVLASVEAVARNANSIAKVDANAKGQVTGGVLWEAAGESFGFIGTPGDDRVVVSPWTSPDAATTVTLSGASLQVTSRAGSGCVVASVRVEDGRATVGPVEDCAGAEGTRPAPSRPDDPVVIAPMRVITVHDFPLRSAIYDASRNQVVVTAAVDEVPFATELAGRSHWFACLMVDQGWGCYDLPVDRWTVTGSEATFAFTMPPRATWPTEVRVGTNTSPFRQSDHVTVATIP